ncbi:MAG: thioredoxin family protein [Candidatus Helarchaeota archaeon]|nr:thioredoxin family protein [Candidatus Helarchaeota archaeon]
MIEEINESELKDLLEKNKIVIVDYSAVWCGPCRIQHMILEKLQDKYKDKGVKIVSIDIDKNRSHAEKINIVAVPTLQIYHKGELLKFPDNGEEVDRFIGVQREENLANICEYFLKNK